MHLYSCCALLLLALVACQAAPSSNLIEENSIHEATNSIQLEDAGAEKDRAKKSTTFCVEVRSGKQEQVPCRQEVRPVEIVRQDSKPVVIVPIPSPMPIPAPAPVFPTYVMPPRPQEVKQEVVHQSPVVQPSQPIPAPPSIINIVPPQVPVPCDKQTVVQPQSQHFHTVHVIHPPQTERPVTLVQEARPMKHIKPPVKPTHLPIPHKEIVLPSKPVCQRCNGVIPSHPVNFVVQPSPATVLSVLPQVDACKYQEEGPQCSCQSENSPTSRLGPYPRRYVMPRAMEHPDDATFESMGPFRSPIMSLQSDPRIMSEHPTYFTSEGANREMEARTHRLWAKKKYSPVNLSVQFPVVHTSDNAPKFYESVYRPVYTNPSSYTYVVPSPYSYESYGNYRPSEYSYPVNYNSQDLASGTPSVTVNAGGPFYGRESQHNPSPQTNDVEMLPREAFTPVTDTIDPSSNQKRETDMNQSNNEQNKAMQTEVTKDIS